MRVDIPEKSSFKIGEVGRLLGVEPYVLRYWEGEFDELNVPKTRSGQRMYRRQDIELLLRIQELLHVQMYTIAGARRQLDARPEEAGVVGNADWEAEREELERALDEAREVIEEQVLEAQRVALESQEATMAAAQERTQLRRELEEVRADMERKDAELAAFEEGGNAEVVAHLHEAGEMLTQDVARLERELVEYRAQIHDLISQRDALESQCDELSAQLRKQRQGRQVLIESMRREVRGIEMMARRV